MSKKWYSYFVSVEGEGAPAPAGPEGEPSGAATPSAAQTVAELAAAVNFTPSFEKSGPQPLTFEEIYKAAGLVPPTHGFTVFKIAEMLKSEHIRTLPVEIKRSSVLLALDAAGVKLQEIIEDAVRRDRALDAFETVQQRALDQLEARKAEENQKLQLEADRVLNELRTKIQANNDEVAKERERIQTWRLQKHQEEQRIADAVGPFTPDNPITTGPVAAAPPAPQKASS